MVKDEYLVARVGGLYFGIFCRDVKNVYSQQLKLAKLHYQSSIFRGITHINGSMLQIIDLRRRIGMPDEKEPEVFESQDPEENSEIEQHKMFEDSGLQDDLEIPAFLRKQKN